VSGPGRRIGIIVALAVEAETLPAPVTERYVVVKTGMGAERAYRGARELIRARVGGLVSWGTAVALSPALNTGDLVVPEAVCDQEGRRYEPDTELQARITPQIRPSGLLGEASTPLCTLEQKLRFTKLHGAVAADMETAAIAKAARAAGIPFAVVRVVVDDLSSEIPPWVLRAIHPDGRARVPALTRGLLLSPPGDLAHLWRLGRRLRTALETLRRQGAELQ